MERLQILSNSSISKFLVWTCGPLGLIFNLYVLITCVRNLSNGRKLQTVILVSQVGSRFTDSSRKLINKGVLPTISKVASLLFLSLSSADLLSSLYLLSLALADTYYSNLNCTIESNCDNVILSNLSTSNPVNTGNNEEKNYTATTLSNQWISSPLCLMLRFLTVTGSIGSSLTTLVIIVDRFFIVVYPFKVKYKLNLPRASKICAGIWFFSILLGCITCVIATYTIYGTFNRVSWYNRLCIVDDASNGYVLPYVVFLGVGIFLIYVFIAVVYIITLVKIHKINHHNLNNRIDKKRSNSLKLGVIITGLIVAAGVLSWTPTAVASILFAARLIPYDLDIVSNFATITTLIISANSLVNPLIFVILSARIKAIRTKNRTQRNQILPSF